MAAATPLPEDEDETDAQAPRIVPDYRADTASTTTFLTPAGGIDRPRTPPHLSIEDSRELLTRLTGLQPWQLEAFPDELPPLPISGPSSPTRSPEHARPNSSLGERRLSSSTAVPIRFRKPPVSPAVQQREFPADAETASSPVTQSSPFRRHVKSPSKEFKTSREFRPLYLVERNRKSDELQNEDLPALPASGSPSRASSARESETETEGEYESAHESADFESAYGSPRLSASESSDADPFFDPLSVVADLVSTAPGPEAMHPELESREIEEVTESGQATPRASDFISPAARDVPTSAGPSHDALTAALEQAKAVEKDAPTAGSPGRASPLAASPFLDDKLMRGGPAERSEDFSPTKSSSLLQEAALGALAGGVAGAALQAASSKKGRKNKKGKGKRVETDNERSEPVLQSPLPTPTATSEDLQAYVPTFIENEEDWAKNKPDSIIADDDTLVGEPSAAASLETSKLEAGRAQEKVREATEPHTKEERDVEVRRSIIGDVMGELPTAEPEVLPKAVGEDQDIATTDFTDKPDESDVALPSVEEASAFLPESDIEKPEALQAPVEEVVQAPAPASPPKPITASEPARSSWGSGFWGAIGGWGRKKQSQVAAPVEAVEQEATTSESVSAERDLAIPAPVVEPATEESATEVTDGAPIVKGAVESQMRDVAVTGPDQLQESQDEEPVVVDEPTIENATPVGPSTPLNTEEQPALRLDTQPPSTTEEQDGYKSLPRTYTPQTAVFTDNGRPFSFGQPQVSAPVSVSADALHDKPAETAVLADQPAIEEASARAIPSVTQTADDGTPKTSSGKKKKGKNGKKASAQLSGPVPALEEPAQHMSEPVTFTPEPSVSYVPPQTSYFGDGGLPSFAFPLRVPPPTVDTEEHASRDVPVDEKVSDVAHVAATDAVPELVPGSATATEVEPFQYAVPQTSYFGDGGMPAFSFPAPAQMSTVELEAPAKIAGEEREVPTLEESVAIQGDAKEEPAYPTTEIEPASAAREIVAGTPGADPLTESVIPTPIIEEASTSSKKKGKKNKKKRESTLSETPVHTRPSSPTLEDEPLQERSFAPDATGVDAAAVPLPGGEDNLDELDVAPAPAGELVQEPTDTTALQSSEQDIETPIPVEAASGPQPKKKGKKGKKKSGLQIPEVQTEPIVQPVERSLSEIEAPATAEVASEVSQVSHEVFEDTTEALAQDVQLEATPTPVPTEALGSAPVEADIETDAWLEGRPLDHASTLLEKENPLDAEIAISVPEATSTEANVTENAADAQSAVVEQVAAPLSKKDKKKRKKKGSGFETPVQETTLAPDVSSVVTEPTVVESYVAPEPVESRGVDLVANETLPSTEGQTDAVEPVADVVAHQSSPTERGLVDAPAEVQAVVAPSPTITEAQVVEPDAVEASDRATPKPGPEQDTGVPLAAESMSVQEDESLVLPVASSKKDKKKKKGKKGQSVEEPQTPVSEAELGLLPVEATEVGPAVEPSPLETQQPGENVTEIPESRQQEMIEQATSDPVDVSLPIETTGRDISATLTPIDTTTNHDPQALEPSLTAPGEQETKETHPEDSVPAPIDESAANALEATPSQDEPVVESKKSKKKKKGKKDKVTETEPSTPIAEDVSQTEVLSSDDVPVQGVSVAPELAAEEEVSLPAEEISTKDLHVEDEPARPASDLVLEQTLTSEPSKEETRSTTPEAAASIEAESAVDQAPVKDTTQDELPQAPSEPAVEPTSASADSHVASHERPVEAATAIDSFKGLSKTQKKKLQQKMKAEAALKEAEAEAAAAAIEHGPVQEHVEGATSVEVPQPEDTSVVVPADTEGPAVDEDNQSLAITSEPLPTEKPAATDQLAVEDVFSKDKATADEAVASEEKPVVQEPVATEETEIPAADPFKGLSKTQKKKLQQKMKAEAAQREADAEAATSAPLEEPIQEAVSAAEPPAESSLAVKETQEASEEKPFVDVLVSTDETTRNGDATESAPEQNTVDATSTVVPLSEPTQPVEEAEPVSAVDPFAGLTRKQRKKLQQNMDAETAQKAAEQSMPTEAIDQDDAETQLPAVDLPADNVAGTEDAAPEQSAQKIETATAAHATEASVDPTLAPAEAEPAATRETPEALEASRTLEEVSETAVEEIAVDPFAGLSKKERKKLEKKLKGDTEAKAQADAEAEAAEREKEDAQFPTAEFASSDASEVKTAGTAADVADISSQPPASAITTADMATQEQSRELADVEQLNEKPAIGEILEKEVPAETAPSMNASPEDPVIDVTVPEEGASAEAINPEAPPAETPSVEAEPVDPFKGLNKKQRQRLEKKLKAEAEAKQTEEELTAEKTATTEEAAPAGAAREDLPKDKAQSVDVPASSELAAGIVPVSTAADSELPTAAQVDTTGDQPLQADVLPEKTDGPSVEAAQQEVSSVERDARDLALEPVTIEPTTEQPAETPAEEAQEVDPFKGLNKKQRQRLEKKLKAEAEAKAKEETQPAAGGDTAAIIETTSEPIISDDGAVSTDATVPLEVVADTTALGPSADEAPAPVIDEEKAEEPAPVDPFAGLNKKQRQKLEKKLATEAAKREAEQAVAETVEISAEGQSPRAADDVVEEQAEAPAPESYVAQKMPPAPEQAVETREPEPTAELSTAEAANAESLAVEEAKSAPATDVITESEQPSVSEPAAEPEVDPYAGLTKTQRKKLEKKLKAEAAQKEKDEEEARTQDAVEKMEIVKPAGVEPEPAVAGELVADDTWPAEHMLDEPVAAPGTVAERDATIDEHSDPVGAVVSDAADAPSQEDKTTIKTITDPPISTEVPTTAQTSTEPEVATSETIPEPVAEPEEPLTSKKSKKKKKGKKGDSVSEQTPMVEIIEPVSSSGAIEEKEKSIGEEEVAAAAPSSAEASEATSLTTDAVLEPSRAEPVLQSTEDAAAALSTALEASADPKEQQHADVPTAQDIAAVESDEASLSKKGKKKAKKEKHASAVESDAAASAETPVQETPFVPALAPAEGTPASSEERSLDVAELLNTNDKVESEAAPISASIPHPAAGLETSGDVPAEDSQAVQQEVLDETPVLSKKDKKKAKKNKRVSVAEESAPASDSVGEHTQPPSTEEPSSELLAIEKPITDKKTQENIPVEDDIPTTSDRTVDEAASAEPSIAKPTTTETAALEPLDEIPDTVVTPLSKKDKKKAKKAKRSSVVDTSEPTTPLETPSAELDKFSFTTPSATDAQTTEEPSSVSEVAPETDKLQGPVAIEQTERENPIAVETAEEPLDQAQPAQLSKKDKKKAKKGKRVSVAEAAPADLPETPTDAPLDQSIDQTQTEVVDPPPSELAEKKVKDDQQAATSSSDAPVEAVPSDRPPPLPVEDPEPAQSSETAETAVDEPAPLSKSQKKKAKKAQRASAVESEVEQTATQEPVTEPLTEPSTEPPTESLTDATPSIELPAVVTSVDAEADADEWSGSAPSRKSKKKNKKQNSQTAIDSFLADEATRAANVSEPQPSPSTPITSETPIIFSGIPPQYPQPSADGSVEIATESARDIDGEGEKVAEVRDFTLLDAATEQQENDSGEEKERRLDEAVAAEPNVLAELAGDGPQEKLELEQLAPLEHTQAAFTQTTETVPVDAPIDPNQEVKTIEPAANADIPVVPVDEGLDTASSKKKKKAKKNKHATIVEEPVGQPTEAILNPEVTEEGTVAIAPKFLEEDRAATADQLELTSAPPQVEEPRTEQSVEELKAIDTGSVQDGTEHQRATEEPTFETTEVSEETSMALDIPREALHVTPEPATEDQTRDVPSPAVVAEPIVEMPTLSKKDKKKAKKAKKQSGMATPLEDMLFVDEPVVTETGTAPIEAEVSTEADLPLEAEEHSSTPLGRNIQPDPQPAELAARLEPQHADIASLPDMGSEAVEMKTAAPSDLKIEPEHQFAELAIQAEPQQIDAQITADREFTIEDTPDAHGPVEADAVLTEIQSTSEPSGIVEPRELEVAPVLSKKDKKKNKKNKKQATSAEDTTAVAIPEEGEEPAVSDIIAQVTEPVAEPELELTTGSKPTVDDVTISDNRDMSLGPIASTTEFAKDVVMEESAVPESETVHDAAMSDTTIAPSKAVEKEAPAPLSKKEKKKAKKGKRASGTATPVGEDVIAAQPEEPQRSMDVSIDTIADSEPQTISPDVTAVPEVPTDVRKDNMNKTEVEPEEVVTDKSREMQHTESSIVVEEPTISAEVPAALTEEVVVPVEELAAPAEEPLVSAEDSAVVEHDAGAPTSRKSKKQKKKASQTAALIDESASEVFNSAPTDTITAPDEDITMTEPDHVVASDPPVSEAVNTATDMKQTSVDSTVDPMVVESNDAVLERDLQEDTVPREPIAEEPVEPEQPVLSRKLSKKEKRALKKGAVTPLQQDVVEESVNPTRSAEPLFVDETLPASQKLESPAEAETAFVETPVEPAVQSATEVGTEPSNESTILRDVQDEHPIAPVDSELQDVVAEDEWAPLPKKDKKKKKAKKQLLVSEPADTPEHIEVPKPVEVSEAVEQMTDLPAETLEPATIREPLPVDVPVIEAAPGGLPLPEPTPMEHDNPLAVPDVIEPRTAEANRDASPPLPEPTPLEREPLNPLGQLAEAHQPSSDNVPVLAQPDEAAPETLAEHEDTAETQYDATAPLNRKASKKSKKGKKSKENAESMEITEQTETDTPASVVEDTFMPDRPASAELTQETFGPEIKSEIIEAHSMPADVETETHDEPRSTVQDGSRGMMGSTGAFATASNDVVEEPLARSLSKKDRKKRKKGKKEADRIEGTEEEIAESPAPVENAERPESPTTTTAREIEIEQPATPLHHEAQSDARPQDLSPPLQAVQDEAPDLKQRFGTLNAEVAATEQLGEPAAPQSASIFDIANLLSKKNSDQAEEPIVNDLPEPLTPAVEHNAVVEKKDQVENVVEEPIAPVELPSRKMSKKERRNTEKAALAVAERDEPAVEDVGMRDAPVAEAEDHPPLGALASTEAVVEAPAEEVEKKDKVPRDTVLAPSTASPSSAFDVRSADVVLPQDDNIEGSPVLSRKLSKKDKKRQVKLESATQDVSVRDNQDESPDSRAHDQTATTTKIEEREQAVEPEESVTPAYPLPSGPVGTRGFSAEDSTTSIPAATAAAAGTAVAAALTRKDSKKEKKKGRKSKTSANIVTEAEQSTVLAEPVNPHLDSSMARQEEVVEATAPLSANEEHRPARILEAIQPSEDAQDKASTLTATTPTTEVTPAIDNTQTLDTVDSCTSAKTLDNLSEDVLPTLNKKGSKKHRLAALFENQSPEQLKEAQRGLTHKRSGSVKNLAERFENQSRTTTPLQIVPPKSISRAASEDQLRSVSPYDNMERLRSASPRHDVDFAAAVAAGLNESGFDPSYVINDPSFYRSRSTSRQEDRDDDEVETARRRASVSKFGPFGRASAASSPTKRDFASASPTKLTFSTSPTKATPEPIHDALPRGIEVPVAAATAPSFDPMDILNDPSFVRRRSPPGVLEEADPEELYAPSKSKKPKGKPKRTTDASGTVASIPDSVELKAGESPVFEHSPSRSRTVETAADSTARGFGFDSRVNEPEQSTERSRGAETYVTGRDQETRGRTTERDSKMIKTPVSALPISATDHGVNEYPFPLVLTPEVEGAAGSSLKQDKKISGSRRDEEMVKDDVQVSLQEQHKRRAHPVSFHEEQPEEKRSHRSQAHSGPVLEPAWSFSALDNTEPRTSTIRELDVQRTDRPHPKGPRTPRQKSTSDFRQSQEMEESPALPLYSPSRAAASSPPSEFVSKERASYLFDSSPSTRTYATSPAVAPKTPSTDSPRAANTSTSTPHRQIQEQTSPTRTPRRAEPHRSIFGDPSQKTDVTTTPLPKRARTPGTNSLGTITENSPDDGPLLIKKGRSVTDGGSGERSSKSLRSNRSFSDRIKSPPPTTPTPVSRKKSTQDSPWHQANDPVDRSVALSPARRLPHSTPDPVKHQLAEIRDSPALRSQQSLSNISKLRSPDTERPMSSMSMTSNASNHSLRRIEKAQSGDLRAAAKLGEANAPGASNTTEPNLSGIALAAGATAAFAAASKLRGEGKGRRASMAETFVSSYCLCNPCAIYTNRIQEAMGEAPRSPMSPTRPPSLRKRQSMQIMDLQTQLDQLADHNKSLEDARLRAEETLSAQQHQRQIDEQLVQEAVEARDRQIHQRDIDIAQLRDTLQRLQEEIARLTELNNNLTEANRNLTNDANERYAHLQSEGQLVHQQWQTSQKELDTLRSQHQQLTRGMEGALREEIGAALDDRNAEISRLERELSSARDQIKNLQKQILASKKPSESFLTIRDEDYFDSACQQLCQHVQQWVLRFSKFSDTRACRLSSDIQADARLDAATREKIDKRLDNAILDGSDVDALLADRVRRRDVFMSIVMSMIWEYVFTRYLFGMDREQRQKLKSLEKTLSEVGKSLQTSASTAITHLTTTTGPPRAVAQWRAITLTLLSKRESFMHQRAQDTEAVVHEIYSTLSTLLSPPSHLQNQIQASLRNVMRLAVELSIEMRTQRAEYIMLPPLQPEYDVHGDLIAKVSFNASLMNERSGETSSNDELEARGAIVKVVLFPLVVKKGDDFGEGEDEIVVCPAQVLVARPGKKKVVRVMSGAMSLHSRASSKGRSAVSLAPESSVMDLDEPNVI